MTLRNENRHQSCMYDLNDKIDKSRKYIVTLFYTTKLISMIHNIVQKIIYLNFGNDNFEHVLVNMSQNISCKMYEDCHCFVNFSSCL
jgi:amino acid permease